ncbi:MAG: TatD family hydrolase [Patescibacteria group bacterium]
MLIDTHCHIDQFPSPEEVIRECERSAIRVVAVTNLPSHFAVAADRLCGHKLVSPALGMHPLFAAEGIRELGAFKQMAPYSHFIGEIGLDFSRQGLASKPIQVRVFEEVLCALNDRPRFITLHSRGAESAVMEALRRHKIRKSVFHWFTGTEKVLLEVISDGHFVSINPAMLCTAKGKRILECTPPDRVLVESDGPFAKTGGSPCKPTDVDVVYQALAKHWNICMQGVVDLVRANFDSVAPPQRV